MINLDFGSSEPIEFKTKGFYFTSNNDHYLIEVNIKEQMINCLIKIYEIGIPQRNATEIFLENGTPIATSEATYFMEIDLWPKAYVPKFSEEPYQWYYEYKDEGNKIQSMADVMEFGIEIGLKAANITSR